MLEPEQVCLVAAHNNDLAAARGCGLRTAFIPRPTEHGPDQTTTLGRKRIGTHRSNLEDLAGQLGL